MTRSGAWLIVLLALLPALLLTAGCSTALERVQPWERGELAGDLMRPDVNSLASKDWGHINFSKEASPAGAGAGGGGCGCN
jgi:hypothetical protein